MDVIAGHVQTTGDDRPQELEIRRVYDACWPTRINWASIRVFGALMGFSAPTPLAPPPASARVEEVTVSGARIEARNLGDLKQYPLPEATDVAAKQSKQVQFLDQADVPFERIYAWRAEEETMEQADALLPATIVLRLQNTEKDRLGKPLPAGQIATVVASQGQGDDPLLTEQGELKDTAVGLPLEIRAGHSSQVLAQPRLIRATEAGPANRRRAIREMEVTLTNQKPAPVTVEWREEIFEGESVAEENRPHDARDGDYFWTMKLGPGERGLLRYTLDRPE